MAIGKDREFLDPDTTPANPAPAEPWADFGMIHQFAFPYPGGLYLGFQVWSADRPIVAELGFTRGACAGSMFRPATPDEIRIGKSAGWEVLPKWTWLVPQMRYRFFVGADLLKEMFLMWSMGWEPSEDVKQALATASQEGWEEQEKEDRVKNIIKAEQGGGKGWPPGGGTVQ